MTKDNKPTVWIPLRLDKDLHRQVKMAAAGAGEPLSPPNGWIAKAVKMRLSGGFDTESPEFDTAAKAHVKKLIKAGGLKSIEDKP